MRSKSVGNVATNELSNVEAMAYVAARSAYNYPKAYIKMAPLGHPYDIVLSPTVRAEFVVPMCGDVTDLWLDQYHYDLLHSVNPLDRQLGLASVVYWGFYSHNDNFARNRVSLHIKGHKAVPATTSAVAVSQTTRAVAHLNNKCTGLALSEFSHISQLSRTPFASKVVAFLAPSIAGVYDNRINDGLNTEPWASHIAGGIGSAKSPSVVKCYQSWCVYITHLAAQLNMGISAGKPWRWSCGKDQGQLWRAVDVERAIFEIMGSAGGGANAHG